jgi:hypothetical protein
MSKGAGAAADHFSSSSTVGEMNFKKAELRVFGFRFRFLKTGATMWPTLTGVQRRRYMEASTPKIEGQ